MKKTMPSNHIPHIRKRDDGEDARSLLGSSNNDHLNTDLDLDLDLDDDASPSPRLRPRPSRRQSPLSSHAPPARTPRTTNRVRFELVENQHGMEAGGDEEDDDAAEEPPDDRGYFLRHHTAGAGQRAPLLTDIEAPSVTVANATSLRLNMEELLEELVNRPKSGMMSAFMNMANSIMYVRLVETNYRNLC